MKVSNLNPVRDYIKHRLASEGEGAQQRLADEVGLTSSTIGQFLKGRHGLSTASLARIAKCYGVAVGDMWKSTNSTALTTSDTASVVKHPPSQQKGGVTRVVAPQAQVSRSRVRAERNKYRDVIERMLVTAEQAVLDLKRALDSDTSQEAGTAETGTRALRGRNHQRSSGK